MKKSPFIKRSLFLCTVSALTLSQNSLAYAQQQCEKGSGNIVTQEVIANADFINVLNKGSTNVKITQSDVKSLSIRADDNIVDNITLDVKTESNTLEIINEGCFYNATTEVLISQSEYEELELSGAGEIESVTDINLDKIVLRTSGAGNIKIRGTVTEQIAEVSGAGNINNFELLTQTTDATLSGAGNIEINVTNTLNASNTGSGNITYKGSPATVNIIKSNGAGIIAPAQGDGGSTTPPGDGGSTTPPGDGSETYPPFTFPGFNPSDVILDIITSLINSNDFSPEQLEKLKQLIDSKRNDG